MIAVDVGSNSGLFSRYLLDKHDKIKIFGVEPNLELFKEGLSEISHKYKKRFDIEYCALGKFSGYVRFYNSQIVGGQLGSTHKINNMGEWHKSIAEMIKFNENAFVSVRSLSVKKFLNLKKIKKVDFLKIDTQGSDLTILIEFLKNTEVINGAIETTLHSQSKQLQYINQDNNISDVFRILDKNNFKIVKLHPATNVLNEYNLFFTRNMRDFDKFENVFDLDRAPIFSKYSKIIGIGDQGSTTDRENLMSLLRKLQIGTKHPINSFQNLLYRLIN
jgi:FkbM family methyltransferase